MQLTPGEFSRGRFETGGADGGETCSSVQSARRQTGLVDSKPYEQVEEVWIDSSRYSIARRV